MGVGSRELNMRERERGVKKFRSLPQRERERERERELVN